MIASFTPRFGRLPAAQRRLWPGLSPGVPLGFVLYGGTAISLQLGHRRSVDFDFFHDRSLDRSAIRRAFDFMHVAQTLLEAPETLIVTVPGRYVNGRGAIKVSYFGALDFGRVGEPLLTSDGVAQVASLEDLLAHKLNLILQRAEKRDYEDIAAILRTGRSIERALAAARLFYGKTFQPAASLKALSFFEDGDLPSLSPDDRDILIGAAASVRALPRVALRSRSLAITRSSGNAKR